MAARLNSEELEAALSELSGWALKDDKLHKEYKLGSFIEAFGFISQIALHAEKMNHHPELFNVYNQVKVDLVTHDVDGISELDIKLAKKIDTIARS